MGCSNGKTKDNENDDSRRPSSPFHQRKTLVIDNIDLILKNDNLITDLYEVICFLGRGSFSSVYKVKHINSGTVRAIKEFMKKNKNQKLPNEISIQRSISHPNITKAYEWFEDKNFFYLVTEFLSGGDLLQALSSFNQFGEVEVAIIMKQLISSVAYLHSKNIVHRDLKPNNIMLEMKPNNIEIAIKIIDFGLSEYCDKEKFMGDYAGTPVFMAPEVFKGKYNYLCDIWSCGIIMCILLFGESPFDPFLVDDSALKKAILSPSSINLSKYHGVSDSAKSFIYKLLSHDLNKRPTAEECLKEPWLVEYSSRVKSSTTDIDLKKNLSRFLSRNLLQQACSAYLLYHYENAERSRELKKVFHEMDKSGDGRLTYDELKEGFKKLVKDPFYEANFDKVYEQINSHGGNYIEYDEFLRAMSDFDELLTDNLLREAFDHFDTDKNGTLEVDNIKDALKLAGDNKEDREIISKILLEGDINKDGVLSFSEFKALMLKIKQQ
jgi:calcium-dependent protein kinase